MIAELCNTRNLTVGWYRHRERSAEMESSQPVRRWASVKQAALYGGIGLSKAWELVRRGDILAVRVGRRVLVDLGTLDQFYLACPRMAEPRTIVSLDDLTLSAMDLGGSSEAAHSRDASAGTSTPGAPANAPAAFGGH
jgi:excisionase family DNA binding protein